MLQWLIILISSVFGVLSITQWVLLITTLILLYVYGTWTFNYWEDQGIPFVKPLPFVGTIFDDINKVLGYQDVKRRKLLGRTYGIYEGRNPSILVSDPELLKEILVKKFSVFMDRRSFNLKNEDPVVQNFVSVMNGEEWKRARNVLTPTFTSGRLKQMVPLIEECAKETINILEQKSQKKESVELKRLLSALVTDIISTCAFGMKLDVQNNPKSEFIVHTQRLIADQNLYLFLFLCILPNFVIKTFKSIRLFNEKAITYFKNLINGVINERKTKNIKRYDFLQMLLDAQIQEDTEENGAKPNTENGNVPDAAYKAAVRQVLTADGVLAQALIFLLAGFETISTTVGSIGYLLALHPEIQDKLAEEVDKTLAKNDGKLNYDTIFGMQYMDMVISEAMRLLPAAVRTDRVASEDYQLGEIKLKKGMVVSIPVYSIHMDEEYFPDPEKFDPERFSPENKASINPFTYLPFGAGPRNCIGMRFALLEVKLILARLICNFRLVPCPETEPLDKIEMKINQLFMAPKKGFWVRAETRQL